MQVGKNRILALLSKSISTKHRNKNVAKLNFHNKKETTSDIHSGYKPSKQGYKRPEIRLQNETIILKQASFRRIIYLRQLFVQWRKDTLKNFYGHTESAKVEEICQLEAEKLLFCSMTFGQTPTSQQCLQTLFNKPFIQDKSHLEIILKTLHQLVSRHLVKGQLVYINKMRVTSDTVCLALVTQSIVSFGQPVVKNVILSTCLPGDKENRQCTDWPLRRFMFIGCIKAFLYQSKIKKLLLLIQCFWIYQYILLNWSILL